MKNVLITLITIGLFTHFSYGQEESEKPKVKKAQDEDQIRVTGYGQDTEQPLIRQVQKEQVSIKIKDEANPDFYIDGVKVDASIANLLDPSKIASVDVIKGDKAKEEYNAPNGVVLITSKTAKDDNIQLRSSKTNVNVEKINIPEGKDPLIIIDGKRLPKQSLSDLDPNTIESINVLKDAASLEKYNAVNGVLIITTKKGKK